MAEQLEQYQVPQLKPNETKAITEWLSEPDFNGDEIDDIDCVDEIDLTVVPFNQITVLFRPVGIDENAAVQHAINNSLKQHEDVEEQGIVEKDTVLQI